MKSTSKKLSDVFLKGLLNVESWPSDKDQLFIADLQTLGLMIEIHRRKWETGLIRQERKLITLPYIGK